MELTNQLAKNFRDVLSGGNWTAVNLKDTLADVEWQEATTKVHSLNTIASLVFHMNYYVTAILNVLESTPLTASDKFSFDHPPIQSKEDWKNLLNKTRTDAEKLASFIEQLPESKLWEDFWKNKYGNWYRNIQGITEHYHYHLGQIVLIKKIIRHADKD